MQKSATTLYVILSLLGLAACGGVTDKDGNHHILTPKPLFIRNIPAGNDSYSAGFRAGCNDYMGIAGFGGHRFHDPYTFAGMFGAQVSNQAYQYDPSRGLKEPLYATGHAHGSNYCGIASNAAVGY